ncbi:unnamed protein product [Moneuplotes crassus]|uniref:Uncharacterized protein n=1 Tax=Euplotes crassus TaxID=5936 RepID=A0AAD2D420_EUPCR|nr:unnamed protein product [Moneuplotes crassus]
MDANNLVFYFALGASGSDQINYDKISDSQEQSDYSSFVNQALTILKKRDKIELGVDFKKPSSFGTWYATQFAALTTIILTDSRLDPSAAKNMLEDFETQLLEKNYGFCHDPSQDVDTKEISEIINKLSAEHGSEFNKVELPSIDNQQNFEIEEVKESSLQKMEKIQKFTIDSSKDDLEQPQLAQPAARTAAQLYAQKRNARLQKESNQNKKRAVICIVIAIIVLITLVWLLM